MYELAVWIKMFHMTFSPSHNRGKVVQLVYKPQHEPQHLPDPITASKRIATTLYLYLAILNTSSEVYELAV